MNFNLLLNKADQAIKDKKYLKSLELYEQAFKINQSSFEACLKIALLKFQLKDFNSSIIYFEKLKSINPNSLISYTNLGSIYLQLNNKDLALKNLLKGLEIDPNNFSIKYNLANLYFSNNDLINAEKYFLESVKLQPKHFYPYNNLFQLYDRSNDLKKLEKLIFKIISVFGETDLVNFLTGIYEFRRKNYNKVIEILKNVNIDSKDFQRGILKQNILGKCYDFIGSYQEAFNCFSKSNKLIQDSSQNQFDKNKYINLIQKRLETVSKISVKKLSIEIKDEYEDPVFLIGFPRSGTTMLDNILSTSNSLEIIEEKPLVDEIIFELNKTLKGNLSKLNEVDNDKINLLRSLYFKKRNSLVPFNSKITYVDKLPLNIIHVAELNKIFPKAKFIFVLRNPHDTVLSCFMQPFLPNDAMSNFYDLKSSSELYNLVMTLWLEYQKIINLNVHTVKYEDIVNDFDYTLKQLTSFLNIVWSDNFKNFYINEKNKKIINTPSYNQVNLPIYAKSINRWKNYQNYFLDTRLLLEKWVKIFGY